MSAGKKDSPTGDGAAVGGGIPLRSGLLLLVVAALLPVLVFAGWMVARTADAQRAAVEERVRHLAQTLAVAIDRELAGMASALQVLAVSPRAERGDLAALHAQTVDVLRQIDPRREGLYITLTDREGQQLLNTRRPYGEPLPRTANVEMVRRVVETGQAQVSDLFPGVIADTPLVAVGVPLRRGGTVDHVLSMSIPVEALSGILRRQGLPEGWIAGAWDRRSVILARSLSPERFVGSPIRPEVASVVANGATGSFRSMSMEGIPVFNAWARTGMAGWTVGVGVPLRTLNEPLYQSLVTVAVGGAVLLLAGAAVALAVGRRLSGAVAELARAARALGRGEAPGAVRTWVREVNAVGVTLADAALRLGESEAQQRLAMEAGNVGVWRLDRRTGTLRGWGRSAEILGLPPGMAEAPVADWLRHVRPEEVAQVRAALLPPDGAPGEFALEFTVLPPDAPPRWVALRGAVPADPGGGARRAVGILEDVTATRSAFQARLGEAAERHAADRRLFAAIIESSSDLVAAVDLDMRFILFNGAFQRTMEALYGRTPRIGDSLAETLAAQPQEQERAVALWSRALSGERFVIEESFGGPAGEMRAFEIAFDTLRDADGALIGVFQLVRDVTERARAEEALNRAEDTLRQAQKMEAIGQLTGGIAHDFNNLLQAIGSSLHLIAERCDGTATLEPLGLAAAAVERGATLTQHLLAFSRRQRLEPRAVDVGALARGMAGLLERTLGGTIEVAVDTAAGRWPAQVDPTQLEMALLNLAINARDAMAGGGTLTLRTADRRLGPGDPQPAGLEPGDYVAVAVADTGTGMSAEVAARAFEPFFTTKGVGHGTGLGLSMVHGLAAQSGGAVTLDTRPGDGTTVTLYLPRAPEASATADIPAPRAEAEVGPATVLLVEDEALVRTATAAFLAGSGFTVLEATDGAAALTLLEGRDGAVDLLLTDYAMPGMTGLELLRTVRARWPALPGVMVTGYAEMPAAGPGLDGLVVVQKPYRPDQLLARLRALLPLTGPATAPT
ncbi:response regulator [Azospirillum sp.]|uniref:response regulator n=1 Tax=Azospirillum sp. TaxID=34012 RepID=UPI003D729275